MDTILSDLVLEHICDLGHVAAESARVLRLGGRVRLSELHPQRQRQGSGARFVLDGETIRPPTVTHSVEEYLYAFQSNGFTVTNQTVARAPTDDPCRPPRLLILVLSLSRRWYATNLTGGLA